MKLVQKIAARYYRAKFRVLQAVSKKKAAEKAFELFCTPQLRVKKQAPKLFEEAEKLYFDLDGIRINGYRFNHPSEKKALILHGYESSVINFDRYIRPLMKKGYEVLAFDAPAHGRSGGKKINAPLYKKMITTIHKKFGPVTSYMAHSFGGLAVALAIEEISHSENYKVVFIAPAAETATAADSFFHFLHLDDSLRAEFEKVIIRHGGVSIDWYSIKRAMKNIRAQVLWVQDEDDEITPMKDVLKVKELNFPNIKFMFTKGLGHRRIYRDNKVTKAITDFL
jgi:pimeloyl-ACP methyl ester carboxylesterase